MSHGDNEARINDLLALVSASFENTTPTPATVHRTSLAPRSPAAAPTSCRTESPLPCPSISSNEPARATVGSTARWVPPTHVEVVNAPPLPKGATRLHYSQKVLQAPDIAALRQQQRNGRQNLWETKYFFPNAPEGSRDLRSDICDRDSCLAASTFYCGGMHGCNRGDCARQVESLDIYLWRVRVLGEITLDRPDEAASPANFSSRFVSYHAARVQHAFSATSGTWSRVELQVSPHTTYSLCISAYAVLAGAEQGAGSGERGAGSWERGAGNSGDGERASRAQREQGHREQGFHPSQ